MNAALHDALKAHLSATVDFLRTYRRAGDPRYCGVEEFVLREGTPMSPPQTDPEIERGTPNECFANATHFVLNHPDHLYAEGYMMSADLPIAIHHAWAVNRAGEVIDPTLGWREGAAYLGVRFPTKDLLRRICKSGYYGLYVSDGTRLSPLVLGTDPKFKYRGKHEEKDASQQAGAA